MKVATIDGVQLWWERDGSGVAVILVPGRGDSTDLFPDEFASTLQAGGLSIVRFDPRDTGLSDDGGPAYSLATMADDIAVVLGAAGVRRAHLVGFSIGGLLLADLATRNPDLVASLTFVSAMSPDPEAGMGQDFFASFEDQPLEGRIRAMGLASETDRTWAGDELDRAQRRAPLRPEAQSRHQDAAFRLGWVTLDYLARIAVPTVVVHGSEDRVLPLRHARRLAADIPGATLAIRDGMGHLPRPTDWAAIAGLVINQTRKS